MDTALAVLERYGDPRALRKLGRKRLSGRLIRASRGHGGRPRPTSCCPRPSRGRRVCGERYEVTAEVRAARRRAGTARHVKGRASRGSKESTKAAPASDPPGGNGSAGALVAYDALRPATAINEHRPMDDAPPDQTCTSAASHLDGRPPTGIGR